MAIGPPTGMRDWLPQDTLLRQSLMETIGSTYRLYGYLPIDTPAMEDLTVLLGKGGGENEKLLFKILKRGEKLGQAQQEGQDLADYGLRYDLTVPLARFVATHQGKLPKIFRRYHIAPVWRADRPQLGRYREFYQCDIDVVGGASSDYEVEIITATEQVLKRLGFENYRFRLSDKRLLPLLLKGIGVPDSQVPPILTLLDKVDKIPSVQFETELSDCLEKGTPPWEKVCRLIKDPNDSDRQGPPGKGTKTGQYGEIVKQILDRRVREEIEAIHTELDRIIATVRELHQESRVIFYPTLVRGMDYYTGPIYEAIVEGFSSSILGGGRYDGLIGRFLGKPIPAVGCSIGFERILSILQNRENSGTAKAERVLLVRHGDLLEMTRHAEQLRAKGLAVESYMEEDDLGKQLKYAEAAGLTWAIKEVRAGALSLLVRHLPTRQDRTVSLAEFQELLERQS
ncbi:MAG TPA: histidine--tRNA ligase [Nitrospirales bacterium]